MKKTAAVLVLSGVLGAGCPGEAADEDIIVGKTPCDRVGETRVLGAGTMVKCGPGHVWERVGERPGER